jgi:transcriptional repressor NF-X1
MEITCKATADTKGAKKDLECNDFCAKVSRNRRLALALDIQRDSYAPPSSPALSTYSDKPLSTDDLGYYDETLCDFYKQNAVWCRHMEITLIEFVQNKEKKTFHFKPMRKEYRRFLHRYAIHFNLATEAIDAEPNRSIIMRKSLGNCRIPPILLSKAARNPTLNRPPPTLQALEADASSRSPLRQPVNALYLSDMAFGLTKIELDAELVPLIKIDNDTIPFTSTWVNENDAIVVPSISDSVSMDEKEQIIWQLKKSVKAAFVLSNESSKAARVDCCWVNQKGEVTWSEKMASQPKKEESSTTTTNSKKGFVNSFDALNTVDDDGWMKVGGNNPYKPVRDAWFDSPKSSAASLSVTKDENEEDEIVEIKTEEAEPESTNPIETKDESKNSTPLSDDWEALLDEDEA